MRNMLLVWWLLTASVSVLATQDDKQSLPVLDVSSSHSVEALLQSALKYKLDASRMGVRRTYFLDEQTFVLRLPGGQEVHQRIEHGSVHVLDQELLSFFVAGPVLPLDEAVSVARKFHAAFHMPVDKLEAWRIQALERPLDGHIYTNNAPDSYYPGIGIEIRHTGNPLYPWFVSFNGGWTAPEHKDRNEERAARENPVPPKGMERLSLDAPSGRAYKSEDAYVGLAQEQRELDAKLGQVRDENGQLISPDRRNRQTDSPKPSTSSQPQATVAATKDGNLPPSAQTFLWVAIAALLGAVAGCLFFWSKREKMP